MLICIFGDQNLLKDDFFLSLNCIINHVSLYPGFNSTEVIVISLLRLNLNRVVYFHTTVLYILLSMIKICNIFNWLH